jgi:hypothetical protein
MKNLFRVSVLLCALSFGGFRAGAATWFVATNGSDAASGTNWATAKQTIQSAIDAAAANDSVLVSNGVYAAGGSGGYRININKVISVISANGPSVTTIQGAADPVTTNGAAAVSCAYVGGLAFLSGFTLANGHTATNGSGGGVTVYFGAAASNCVVTGCTAGNYGGGAGGPGTLYNCTLSGNSAQQYGGGAASCTLYDCLLTGNSAKNGGGSSDCTLDRCRLVGNSAVNFGGGSYADQGMRNCIVSGNSCAQLGGGVANSVVTFFNCTVYGNSAGIAGGGCRAGFFDNCIVYSNTSSGGSNYSGSTFSFSCTTPAPGGTGNITTDPQFVSAGSSNFHLLATSPCVDVGTNNDVNFQGLMDSDGNPRTVHGTTDMGAFEFQGYWAWAGGITNSQTNVTDSATGDGYANLLKYATGSSQTNSDKLAAMNSTGLFALRFNRNTNANDITLIAEGANATTNGTAWTGIATNIAGAGWSSTNVSETGAGTPVTVTIQDTTPATNRFLRLRVTKP